MIRWTDQALADFAGQVAWLQDRNAAAAAEMAEDILAAVERLVDYPESGRIGRRAGTRELVTTPRPFVVVYKVADAAVVILRLLHAAQLWPR